jgi:hypothetical protein
MKRILTLAFVCGVLSGCRQTTNPSALPPATMILGGASVSSEGGTIQSGSFWMKEGAIAVALAPSQPGQKELEFSWVVLIKHDWSGAPGKGKSNQTISPVAESDGDGASAGIKVEINGKSFELIDRFRIDQKAKALTDEVLQVNGKAQDLKAGRVFLVDLTAQPPTIEQRAVDLSGPAATVKDAASIEAAALRARDSVIQKDEGARTFAGMK